MKRYFTPFNDLCYPLTSIKDIIRDNNLTELEVTEAIPYKDPDYIWCGFNHEIGERGECGKSCSDYAPKNGKSGCCRHLGQLNEEGEKVVITLK